MIVKASELKRNRIYLCHIRIHTTHTRHVHTIISEKFVWAIRCRKVSLAICCVYIMVILFGQRIVFFFFFLLLNLFMWINKSSNIKNSFVINHSVFECTAKGVKCLRMWNDNKIFFFQIINHRITSFDCNFFMLRCGNDGDALLSTCITPR